MKKIVLSTFAALMIVIVIYLAGAFTYATFTVSKWDMSGRAFVAGMSVILGLGLFAYVMTWYDEN